MIADDDRRCVAANPAACLLLRLAIALGLRSGEDFDHGGFVTGADAPGADGVTGRLDFVDAAGAR